MQGASDEVKSIHASSKSGHRAFPDTIPSEQRLNFNSCLSVQLATILFVHDTDHNIIVLKLQLVYIFLSKLQVLPHYCLHFLPLFVLSDLIGNSLALPLDLLSLLNRCLHRIIYVHARQYEFICETFLAWCDFLSFWLLVLVLDEDWGSMQHLLRVL